MEKKKVNLVLEGGGVKGIGLVGAIAALDKTGFNKEDGYDPKNYEDLTGYDWNFLAGTSAGAIIATLLAVGYTGRELYKELSKLDFSEMMDHDTTKRLFLDVFQTKWLPFLIFKIPQILTLWNRLEFKHGLFDGGYVEDIVRDLIEKKKNTRKYTFKDLAADYKMSELSDKKNISRLNLMTTDITKRKLMILPKNAKDFGKNPDEMELVEAMRMSMAFPFFFTPKKYTFQNEQHWMVDGGVLSNFPAWLFDKSPSPLPTIGLLLDEQSVSVVESHIDMLKGLINTVLSPLDQAYISEENNDKTNLHTIKIPVAGVKTLEFKLSDHKKQLLYKQGLESAEKFMLENRSGIELLDTSPTSSHFPLEY